MTTMLRFPSSFGHETGEVPLGEYAPGAETIEFVSTCRVLVIGAGGLGCEILKNLACAGIRDITVIDMDTIDVTNLNRQFLFRQKDVGAYKAEVAAAFIRGRFPNIKIEALTCRIQEKPIDFYAGFACIIGGLDNIEARRWLNIQIHQILERDEEGQLVPETVIPFIDGGSEGFKGQARVIVPGLTSCFECTLDLFPPQVNFQLCTVAETPRKPEHCIAWSLFAVQKSLANPDSDVVREEWDAQFGVDAKLDKDDPDMMAFIHRHACARAEAYGIEGVSMQLTSGVVKRIIPAIASTNAVIAAACTSEAWKYLSYGSRFMNNYLLFNGVAGVYSNTYAIERKEDCLVCSEAQLVRVERAPDSTLESLLEHLTELLRLERPSISMPSKVLYMAKPESLRAQTAPNLALSLQQLFPSGTSLVVNDPAMPGSKALEVLVTFH